MNISFNTVIDMALRFEIAAREATDSLVIILREIKKIVYKTCCLFREYFIHNEYRVNEYLIIFEEFFKFIELLLMFH